jgi:hypothetical protein
MTTPTTAALIINNILTIIMHMDTTAPTGDIVTTYLIEQGVTQHQAPPRHLLLSHHRLQFPPKRHQHNQLHKTYQHRRRQLH